MAQQTINLGGSPNDGTGDTLRTGGQKINDNFTEVYSDKANENNRTVDDTLLSPSSTGTISQILSWIGGLIKGITGKSSWLTAPVKTIEQLNTEKANLSNNTFTGTQNFSSSIIQIPVVTVADDTARFALTTDDVRNGMVVEVTSDEKYYFIVDQTQLGTDDGYSLLNPSGPVVIQLRQGTDSDRQSITPASGEPVYTTDKKMLWLGDGSTLGGLSVGRDVYFNGGGDVNVNHFRVRNTAALAGAGVDVIDLSTSTFLLRTPLGVSSIDVLNKDLISNAGFAAVSWRSSGTLRDPSTGVQMVSWSNSYLYDGADNIVMNWSSKRLLTSWRCSAGFGMWDVVPPTSKPATPTDLAGVISLLQSYGMCE